MTNAISGQSVTIVADQVKDGEVLDQWKVESGDVVLSDDRQYQASFIMSATPVEILATWRTGTYVDVTLDWGLMDGFVGVATVKEVSGEAVSNLDRLEEAREIFRNVCGMEKELFEEQYPFLGWYRDMEYQTQYDVSQPVTGDMVLYAKTGMPTVEYANVTYDKMPHRDLLRQYYSLEPTLEFKEYIEKEKRGEVTMDAIKQYFGKKCKVKEATAST